MPHTQKKPLEVVLSWVKIVCSSVIFIPHNNLLENNHSNFDDVNSMNKMYSMTETDLEPVISLLQEQYHIQCN